MMYSMLLYKVDFVFPMYYNYQETKTKVVHKKYESMVLQGLTKKSTKTFS